MREVSIDGVVIKKLVRHPDERGFFMEILRDDDGLLRRFGQTSYTISHPGVVKAFHWHKLQDDLWFIATGTGLVVLHDLREGSPTRGGTMSLTAGEDEPLLLLIPAGVAHGYKVLGDKQLSLFYHTTQSYDPADPDEGRIPHDDPTIGFDWDARS